MMPEWRHGPSLAPSSSVSCNWALMYLNWLLNNYKTIDTLLLLFMCASYQCLRMIFSSSLALPSLFSARLWRPMCVKPIVRIVLHPCLDWNTCAGALVNHVSSLCFHCKRSSLNPHPSPPSQPLVQDTCRQITLLPAFIAPCLSFSFTYLLFFLLTLDNNNPHLTTAVQH